MIVNSRPKPALSRQPALIRPFAALRPLPEHAAEVAAPPYDVVTVTEARAQVVGKPWSFLHVSRPEIDLPEQIDPYDPAVYARGAENFVRMQNAGVLKRDEAPYYYVYRLIDGEHCQTGLVATVAVRAYRENRVRRHELTVPAKESDRARHIDTLNAQTGPALLTYRASSAIDELVGSAARDAPELDFCADDGVRHSLWVVRDQQQIAVLSNQFEDLNALYIADGHHRSAAASTVVNRRGDRAPGGGGEGSHAYFLAVMFPDRQLRILDYNRTVADLNGLSKGKFLAAVSKTFKVEPQSGVVRPQQRRQFGMYLGGLWYRLSFMEEEAQLSDDPVACLDVALLASQLLEPILGIRDPRRDRRIEFMGGIRGLNALQQRVDCGDMAVGFSLYPTTIGELFAVADAGLLMPPKSTWFEPKLADGLVSHVLD
ncbi:MAG: DUF1015 family protein [Gammaproteobacteria bacterium]|jgi:uncharacterized protein (DUF1015 family)